MKDTSLILWQMPSAWGLPNPSPFCMKVETWLRMTGVPFTTRTISGPPKSSSGKVPYIERPDGTLVCDSTLILSTLTEECGVSLDEHLSDHDRTVGVLLQRTFEENIYFHLVYDRWVSKDAWKIVEPAYFGAAPLLFRKLVLPFIRRRVVATTRAQGIALLPPGLRRSKGEADIAAVANVLADKDFLFGEPSSFDAVAYGFLENLRVAPVQSFVGDAVRSCPSLVSYCQRIRERYYD